MTGIIHAKVKTSAKVMVSQTPVSPQKKGKINSPAAISTIPLESAIAILTLALSTRLKIIHVDRIDSSENK